MYNDFSLYTMCYSVKDWYPALAEYHKVIETFAMNLLLYYQVFLSKYGWA